MRIDKHLNFRLSTIRNRYAINPVTRWRFNPHWISLQNQSHWVWKAFYVFESSVDFTFIDYQIVRYNSLYLMIRDALVHQVFFYLPYSKIFYTPLTLNNMRLGVSEFLMEFFNSLFSPFSDFITFFFFFFLFCISLNFLMLMVVLHLEQQIYHSDFPV